jgi:hypothetical protein
MNQVGCCIAVYPFSSCDSVLDVIRQLQSVDIPDQQLSVISSGLEAYRNKMVVDSLPRSSYINGISEGSWFELVDLLNGEAFIQASDFDLLTVIGALSSSETFENYYIKQRNEFSELHKLLYLVGVPQSSFEHYESFLKTGKLLLIAHGDHQLIEYASNLLDTSNSMDVALHFINTD